MMMMTTASGDYLAIDNCIVILRPPWPQWRASRLIDGNLKWPIATMIQHVHLPCLFGFLATKHVDMMLVFAQNLCSKIIYVSSNIASSMCIMHVGSSSLGKAERIWLLRY